MTDWSAHRRIPIIGDDIYQVGQVIDIWAQPCGPEPMLAVEAAFTYLPTLIWTLVKPDPLDLVYDRMGQPHRRIRKRKVRADDFMRLPKPSQPGLQMAYFRLGAAAQRFGWYLIVADATSDFLINWTSMAFSWSGCEVDDAPWGRFYGGPTEVGATFFDIRADLPGTHSEESGGVIASNGSIILVMPGPKMASGHATVSLRSYAGQTPVLLNMGMWHRKNAGPKIYDAGDVSQLDDGLYSSTFGMKELWGETTRRDYGLWAEWAGAWLTVENCSCTAHAAPPTGLNADP